MGQMTFGIMYGCECKFNGGEDDEDDRTYYAAHDFNGPLPGDVAHEGGVTLIGLWIAVGQSGEKGAANLNYKSLRFTEDGLRERFPAPVAAALRSWPDFAAFVKEKSGRDLGAPQFWLTATEVA